MKDSGIDGNKNKEKESCIGGSEDDFLGSRCIKNESGIDGNWKKSGIAGNRKEAGIDGNGEEASIDGNKRRTNGVQHRSGLDGNRIFAGCGYRW